MPSPRRIGIAVEIQVLYKHHTDVFAGLQRYADEQGWLTIFDDWAWEALAKSPLGRPAYDGVIARVTRQQIGLVEATAKAGVALVNVVSESPAYDELPGVFPDFKEAGRLRAEHLLSRGLRSFACLSVKTRATFEWQTAGFVEAIAAAGHTIDRFELTDDWDDTLPLYRKNQARIRQWMDGWTLPVGVVLPTDVIARLIAQIAHERGWRVPADVAIIGGRNELQLCERPRPSLTSVEMGFERVGYEAARLLDTLMDEADRARAQRKPSLLGRRSKSPPAEPMHLILPPVGVVVRESTDFYASGDDVISQAQAYIAEQCHTHLDVGDVAAKVCVSVRTLQTRFAAVLGRTVADEIRRVRLEKVKRELTASDHAVHEIAKRAGFTSNAHLSKVFKRELGVSPSEYRAERKPPKER